MSRSKRRRLDPQIRRREILEAAERLLAARGPGVRVEDVVSEAGAAKGTFYLYFPTWDDLLEALRARVFERFEAANPLPDAAQQEDIDWPATLDARATAFVDAIQDMGGLHDVLFHGDFAQRRPLPADSDAVGRLAMLIRSGRDAGCFAVSDIGVTARLLFAVIHEAADLLAAGTDRAAALAGMRQILRRALCGEA